MSEIIQRMGPDAPSLLQADIGSMTRYDTHYPVFSSILFEFRNSMPIADFCT